MTLSPSRGGIPWTSNSAPYINLYQKIFSFNIYININIKYIYIKNKYKKYIFKKYIIYIKRYIFFIFFSIIFQFFYINNFI